MPMAKLRYADVQERRDPEEEVINLRQTVTSRLSNIPLAPGESLNPRNYSKKARISTKTPRSAVRRCFIWQKLLRGRKAGRGARHI